MSLKKKDVWQKVFELPQTANWFPIRGKRRENVWQIFFQSVKADPVTGILNAANLWRNRVQAATG